MGEIGFCAGISEGLGVGCERFGGWNGGKMRFRGLSCGNVGGIGARLHRMLSHLRHSQQWKMHFGQLSRLQSGSFRHLVSLHCFVVPLRRLWFR